MSFNVGNILVSKYFVGLKKKNMDCVFMFDLVVDGKCFVLELGRDFILLLHQAICHMKFQRDIVIICFRVFSSSIFFMQWCFG